MNEHKLIGTLEKLKWNINGIDVDVDVTLWITSAAKLKSISFTIKRLNDDITEFVALFMYDQYNIISNIVHKYAHKYDYGQLLKDYTESQEET